MTMLTCRCSVGTSLALQVFGHKSNYRQSINKNQNFEPYGGTIKKSQREGRFLLWGWLMSELNFMAVHPILVVDIHTCWPKWWTDRESDHLSVHSVAKCKENQTLVLFVWFIYPAKLFLASEIWGFCASVLYHFKLNIFGAVGQTKHLID